MFIMQIPQIHETDFLYRSIDFGGWIFLFYKYPYQRRVANMEPLLLSITIDTETYDPINKCRPLNVYARTYKWYRSISGCKDAPYGHVKFANGCYTLDLSEKEIQFVGKNPTDKPTIWESFLKVLRWFIPQRY